MRRLGLAILLLSLLGCAAPTTTSTVTTSAPTATLPPNLRPEIAQHWLRPDGDIRWPADDGFAAAPVPIFLPAGALIDRFGGDGGNFLSPKGAPYGGRALPYICAAMRYVAYRVALPLLAWTGRAAPWFGEPGGATQFKTDAPVAQLLADHVIEPLSDPSPAPCPKS